LRNVGRVLPGWCLLAFVCLAAPSVQAGDAEDEGAAWNARMERGLALYEAKRFAEADAVFVAAADEAREKAWGPEFERYPLVCRVRCLQFLRDDPALRDTSVRLLEVQREILRAAASADVEDAPDLALDVADTLMDLGHVQTRLGDLRDAVERLQEAVRIAMAQESRAHLGYALARLADAEQVWGRLGPAQVAAEAAEELLRDLDRPGDRVANWLVLTKIHLGRRDEDRAQACVNTAGKILEAWPDAPPSMRAHLKELRSRLGPQAANRKVTTRLLEESRDLKLGAGDVLGAAFTELDLAKLEMEHGEPKAALARLASPLVTKAPGGLIAAETAIVRGVALYDAGTVDPAVQELERAVALTTELGSHGQEAAAWQALATIRFQQGKPAAAADAVREALSLLDRMATRLTPLAERTVRHEQAALFRLAARIGVKLTDPASAYDLLERTRASALLQQLGGAEGSLEHAAESVRLRVRRARDRLVLARAALRAADAGNSRALQRQAGHELEAAQVTYAEALERARRASLVPLPALAATAPEEPREETAEDSRQRSLVALQQTLGKHEVYVAYAVTTEVVHALVATREIAAIRRLGSRADLETAIAAFRSGVDRILAQRREGGPLAEDSLDPSALRDLLVAGLGLPATTTRLVVSPDHGLASVPFTLLMEPTQETVLVPSGAVYTMLSARVPERGRSVLAVGDPTYRAFPDDRLDAQLAALRSPRGAVDLTPLEHTRAEVEAITGHEGDKQLLDAAASEDGLLDQLSKKRWRSVHLACHGLLDPVHPEWSALALTPSVEADGFLTVLEVLGLNVRADAVVLSACETGLGAELSGDGLLGLSTAFLSAGAPRVVASLWPVDDQATSVLMKRFYELWNPEQGAGIGAAAALRGAQEHVRTTGEGRWAHPFYWAGWVLWGLPD